MLGTTIGRRRIARWTEITNMCAGMCRQLEGGQFATYVTWACRCATVDDEMRVVGLAAANLTTLNQVHVPYQLSKCISLNLFSVCVLVF